MIQFSTSWVILPFFLVWMLFFIRSGILFPVMLAAFFSGVLVYSLSAEPIEDTGSPYTGKILSPPKYNGSAESFSLKTDEGVILDITHFVGEGSSFFFDEFKAGAECRVQGEIESFPAASNPGEFDYSGFMQKRGYGGQVEVEHTAEITCDGSSLLGEFYERREMVMDELAGKTSTILWPWMKALVFGEQTEIREETLQAFREWGASHILAISGLHVGLLCGLIYVLFYRSGVMTLSQVKILILSVLPIFAFVAGSQPSVLRASLMACFMAIMWYLKLKPSMTDILSAAAFILLFINPSLLYNAGFQFSFAVTFSLLLSADFLGRDTRAWVLSLRVALISQLALLPLQLYYFYEFSPLSSLINLLLVPYFTLFFIPSIFLLFLAFFSLPEFVYEAFTEILGGIHVIFIDTVLYLGEGMNVQWVTGEFPLSWFLPYYLCFYVMMDHIVKGENRAAFCYGALLSLVLIVHSSLPYINEEGKVTFLDVGQGDSAVIELPHRRGVIIVDAAGPPHFQENRDKIAENILVPFLNSRGIRKVDAVFITHNDSDHNGSFAGLLEDIDVGRLFVSPYDEGDYKFKKTELSAGDTYGIEGYEFRVLSPGKDHLDKNDNSLVLHTALGGKGWLFTGDISAGVEKTVQEAHGPLPVAILKVAHHGSKTSTSELFLDTFEPGIGIISAGRNNRYGHPHPEVLRTLEKAEVEVWRTDRHGAVTVTFTDSNIATVTGFLSP
ncbi:DNA internalization-related competence protein ComEC/Rec2 [Salimicrobium album]|uniref:DNA internalization-related competence protein ComEC/Rec2 n=1 Tax=Salimicrobium album TaxID=50717 RepID=UPI00115F8438|nr:DNA internalization-related competence protein ComEC/Rec2 [Salimicrobium album]